MSVCGFGEGRFASRDAEQRAADDQFKCKNCDCSHGYDGFVIPAFDVGDCICHRIGGSFVQPVEHDYETDLGSCTTTEKP